MTARMIVKESEEVTKMAKKVAAVCTDKRMKMVSHFLVHLFMCFHQPHVHTGSTANSRQVTHNWYTAKNYCFRESYNSGRRWLAVLVCTVDHTFI